MPIRTLMKQSSSGYRHPLLFAALTLSLSLSIAHAQQVTAVDPVVSTSNTTGFVPSDAALDPSFVQNSALGVANNMQAQALQQQQAALAAQQQALAQQQAALAQQQAAYPNSPNNTPSWLSVCGAALSGLGSSLNPKSQNATREMNKALDDYNTSLGNQYDPEIPQETAKRVASQSYDMKYGASGGLCPDFMGKDGTIGPLGRVVQAEIEKYPNSFENKNLRDLNSLCPKYNSMDKPTKKLFWVRFFSILAYKESSCNPRNDNVPSASNPNSPPNGTAYGLFQLDKNAGCGNIDYHNPNENTRCAVKRMSVEMSRRDTFSSPCSNPAACRRAGVASNTGTYWGELRNDDNNPGRKGDTRAAIGLRRAVSGFSECH